MNRIAGPGIGLPIPQILYPANLTPQGVPYTQGSSDVSLAAGSSIQIPAGDWFIDLGKYSILEYQDPVRGPASGTTQLSGVWRPIRTQRGSFTLRSDGVNFRISNLTGCAVAATVTAGGSGYVQASTTVTPSVGNSTWQPVVGGAISALTCSVVGANYGKAPTVFIPSPPAPGVQATAIATISAGKVNGFTVTNQGAGYTTAPTITILADPFDAAASITNAVATASLTSNDTLTAVLCTNPGAPVATSMTLTIAGGNNSATATPTFLTTISAITISAIGSGTFTGAAISTYGGVAPATPAFTEFSGFIPRQAQILPGLTNANLTPGASTIVDGGLFLGSAFPIVTVYGGTIQTAPTVTLTQGSATDNIIVQPL